MLKQLEMKHELFNSIEEMLAPDTLSALLQIPITDVQRSSLAKSKGASNNRFEWVTAVSSKAGEMRYALKRIQFQDDWLMVASNDILCRSVTLWQYGLLDKLSSHLDHVTVACSRDGEGWAILMKDVSAGQFPTLDRIASPQHIHAYLDALAFMHATFWEDEALTAAHLGLNDCAGLISMMSVPTASTFAQIPGEIGEIILEGWEIVQAEFEPDSLEIFRELMLNPQPLYDAMARCSKTLVHGDYRAGNNPNLSYMAAQPVPVCVLDWQLSGYALMTIDVAGFANRTSARVTFAPHIAAEYYGERLEHYLGFTFKSTEWQTMLDLGMMADSMRMACLVAHHVTHKLNDEYHTFVRAELDGFNNYIRTGARWL